MFRRKKLVHHRTYTPEEKNSLSARVGILCYRKIQYVMQSYKVDSYAHTDLAGCCLARL